MNSRNPIQAILFLFIFMLSIGAWTEPVYAQMNWEEWLKSIRNYEEQRDDIAGEREEITQEIETVLNTPGQKRIVRDRTIIQTIINIALLRDKLMNLVPPQDLQSAHDKLIAALNYQEKLYDAALRNSHDEMVLNKRMMLATELESAQELKQAYLKHAVAQEIIASCDSKIGHFKQLLAEIGAQ